MRTPVEQFAITRQFGYNFRSNFVRVTLSSGAGSPRVHYLDEGPADAKTVLILLHGEPFWSHSFHRLIPYLTVRGYQVIVPDLIGFGR